MTKTANTTKKVAKVVKKTSQFVSSEVLTYLFLFLLVLVCIIYYARYCYKRAQHYSGLRRYSAPEESLIRGHKWLVTPVEILRTLRRIVNSSQHRLARLRLGLSTYVLVSSDGNPGGVIDGFLSYPDVPDICKRHAKVFSKWLGSNYAYGRTASPQWRFGRGIIINFLETFTDVRMGAHVRDYVGVHTENLKTILTSRIFGEEVVDIYPYISRCTLKIMFETATGYQLNEDIPCDLAYIKGVEAMHRITSRRIYSGWARRILCCICDFFRENWHLKSMNDKLFMTYGSKFAGICRVRGGRAAIRRDISNNLLEYGIYENRILEKDTLLPHNFRNMMEYFIFRGHEPMTSAICFTLLVLSWFPSVQEAIFKEQMQLLQYDRNATPTYNQVKQMKLLEKVVNETMRAYPPVPLIYFTAHTDCRFYRQTIPKDTEVWLHLFAYFRNLNRQVDGFDASRYYSEDKRHPPQYLFGVENGIKCPGQKFALFVIKMVVSKIVLNYKLEKAIEERKIILRAETVLRSQNGIPIKFVSRDDMEYQRASDATRRRR